MLFQMQKTRLNLDTRHRIGNHLIDVAAEVYVEAVALLVVVVVLTGRVLNGRSASTQVKKQRVVVQNRVRSEIRRRRPLYRSAPVKETAS